MIQWKKLGLMIIISFCLVLLTGCGDKFENTNTGDGIVAKTDNITSNNTTSNQLPTTKEIGKDESGNAIINANEITSTATFYTYTFDDNVKVNLFAVKTSDGIVRTAFNTCQVCNPSPEAYFLQKGSNFVCQNCKNQFAANKIGVEKGGCNPIPITTEDKEVKGDIITVGKSFIASYKEKFDIE